MNFCEVRALSHLVPKGLKIKLYDPLRTFTSSLNMRMYLIVLSNKITIASYKDQLGCRIKHLNLGVSDDNRKVLS